MTITYSRDGVTVTANKANGRLSVLQIQVPEAAFTIIVRNCAGAWHLTMPGRELEATTFETIWDAIPKAVQTKRNTWISIKIVLAEIINRHGGLTAPGFGYSKHVGVVEAGYARLMGRYGGDESVSGLRRIAEKYGYSVVPNLRLIAAHPECHAYHEVVGSIYDAMTERGSPSMEDVLRASQRVSAFHEQLEAASAEQIT